MRYTAESVAEKWFKVFSAGIIKGNDKYDLKTDIERAIKEAVEDALYTGKSDDLNDAANYRIARRDKDAKYFVLFKDLVQKIPQDWVVIMPNRGILSKKYYSPDGSLDTEFFNKFPVIRTESELNLNS